MKTKAEKLRELEIKMRVLWYNQERRFGALRAWESPRFNKYELQWQLLAKELNVDYTVGDVLA